jgi:hypothetical protein
VLSPADKGEGGGSAFRIAEVLVRAFHLSYPLNLRVKALSAHSQILVSLPAWDNASHPEQRPFPASDTAG